MLVNFLINRLDWLLLKLNFDDKYKNNTSLFLNFNLSIISPYLDKTRDKNLKINNLLISKFEVLYSPI